MRKNQPSEPFAGYTGNPIPEENALEMDIAVSIDTMRYFKNWSQKDLAKKIGTSQSAIARLESGWSTPSLTLLKRIAKVFDKILRVSFLVYLFLAHINFDILFVIKVHY